MRLFFSKSHFLVEDGGREDLRPVEVRGFCDERRGHPPAQARGSGQLGAKPNFRVSGGGLNCQNKGGGHVAKPNMRGVSCQSCGVGM